MDKYGSQWRKWDLHVHSPASVLNNNFAGSSEDDKWKRYFTRLRALKDIAVLGITDYWCIDGFLKTRDEGQIRNSVLLPNVEMRIIPVTRDENPVHMHIIFDPSIADDLGTKFFSNLEFTYQQEKYKCIRCDLIRLGRDFKNQQSLAESAAYYEGIRQFKTTIEDLKYVLSKSKDIRKKSLIVVSNKGHDGTSGIRESGLQAIREDIIYFADLIFSSNPNDAKYFIGDGVDSKEELIRKFRSLKPCIHGSDAHDLSSICHPCTKRGIVDHKCDETPEDCELRHCWIKADPIFEGLRQILFEPKYRVHIGDKPPMQPLYKITNIDLDFPNDTMVDDDPFCLSGENKIHLSPNLTCFIGGRGTGKSTILHLINEKLNPGTTDFEVIKKLKVPDKSLSDCISLDNADEEKYFEFVSQNEIESLALDVEKFTGSIFRRIEKFDSERQLVQAKHELDLAIDSLRRQISLIIEKKEKNSIKSDKAKALQTNKNILKSVESDEYIKITDNIRRLGEKISNIQKGRDDYSALMKSLKEIKELYNAFDSPVDNKYQAEFNKLLTQINEIIEESSKVDFEKEDENERKLLEDLNEIKGDLNAFLQNQGLSQEDLGDISGASEIILELERQIKELESKIRYLEEELQVFDPSLAQLARNKYEQEIKAQLKPISKRLELIGEEVKPISLKYEFDFKRAKDRLLEEFQKYFDKDGTGPRIDHLENYLLRQLPLDVSNKENLLMHIKGKDSKLNKTQEFLINVLTDDINFDIYKLLIESIYVDIESFKAIQVFYDNKPLISSSFGQRCTAAIVVLLSLGNNPIIIDEPEAHLDSSLIANYLVNLLKVKKQSRQIIFATHNANFVVNGDSELINILEIKDNKTIITPATIENLDYREDLLALEGGEKAFETRGDKYDMHIEKLS
jgi:energy-coupling factor transporter ATP-binding protein EcfA2